MHFANVAPILQIDLFSLVNFSLSYLSSVHACEIGESVKMVISLCMAQPASAFSLFFLSPHIVHTGCLFED